MRTLTHAMRLETVRTMIETGEGEELYKAHENIYRMIADKDMEHMDKAVKATYFTDKLKNDK